MSSFAITIADATKLQLPGIGFQVTMKRGGWTVHGPTKDQYVMASGPPGGPLIFMVKPNNDGTLDQIVLVELFRRATNGPPDPKAIVQGPEETLTLGGKKLTAQSFRTGQSMTSTNWCAIKVPSDPSSRQGALFILGHGVAETAKPSCKAAREHPALGEIISTLKFE